MHCLSSQYNRRKNKEGAVVMFNISFLTLQTWATPHWPHYTHTHTHTHTVNMTLMEPTLLSPVCSPCQKPHFACVLSLLMSTPAETQQTYHNTFFSLFLKMADRDKTEAVLFKVCCVCPSLCFLFICHWRKWVFVLSSLTEPKSPRHLPILYVLPAAHSCIIKAMIM